MHRENDVKYKLPIKILHLISSRGLYGAERVVINLIAAADNRHITPSLALLQSQQNICRAFSESVKEKGADVYHIFCKKWIDIKAIRQLIILIRSQKIVILHCHGIKARIYGLIVKVITGIHVVTTHHNWTKSDFRTFLFEKIDALCIRFFIKIIAVSFDIENDLKRIMIPEEKVCTVINGIDTDEFQRSSVLRVRIRKELGIGDNEKLIGTFGRLSAEKGQKYLIESSIEVLKNNPTVHFIIIGDGPDNEALKKYAMQLGVSEKIIFRKFEKNISHFYSALDVFVLPSIIEGTSMVLLEAMSSSLPVIATKVGGNLHVIKNIFDGILVPHANSSELSIAINMVINDKKLSDFLSGNARNKIISGYSSKMMSDKYIEIYKKILKN